MMKKLVLLLLAAAPGFAADPSELLTASDLAKFENPEADARIHYGEQSLQFGDLRVPAGVGPHPVAVFIHGGCWLSEYDISHSSALTAALAEQGIATWSLEYRRVGDAGGGWPGTFEDIARGADHLRSIAAKYNLDLDRVIAMGHSAGGHLALWLAARARIPAEVPISTANPLELQGVLALAPAPGLADLHEAQVCGHVIDRLMGGAPAEVPRRYRWADPTQNAPDGVPQVLVIGKHDANWAPNGLQYYETAVRRGDSIRKVEAPQSGHFEVIDPRSSTWQLVLDEAWQLLGKQ